METETRKSTGITDQNGKEIFENDDLILRFESIELRGRARLADDGDWQLYKDEGNYVSIRHNRSRISIL